ncbi:tyrosinase family protein [Streptomyces sp. LX-29]|uniref:tyrosinase MelC2 n=1 Tax=Streptomyces sp. LX-29 TaxID=2900152 RepID=UPI00240E1458|nr:tyrosinase family protein [Streptomyces sp. LX-29]WFB09551.1 tyrosinase family protein [Streptomyces sp. LX-29]
MAVRKNQASLTATEKRNFVNAVLELKRSGRYDGFVRVHNSFIMSDTDNGDRVGHRSPSFLPWHRQFLLQFERELQAIDSSVTLPYWDWTADRTVNSTVWSADFLGGNGRPRDGQVTTGPFAFSGGRWPINVSVDSRDYLVREMGARTASLPTRAEVDSVLAMSTYDTAPWNSASNGFRNHLEGWRGVNLHNRVHVWMGGQMATGVSPNDPIFWLHHCFIDKLWTEWQRRHPGSTYLPTGGTADVVDRDEPMRPWNDVTPADMWDHTRFYTYDTAA